MEILNVSNSLQSTPMSLSTQRRPSTKHTIKTAIPILHSASDIFNLISNAPSVFRRHDPMFSLSLSLFVCLRTYHLIFSTAVIRIKLTAEFTSLEKLFIHHCATHQLELASHIVNCVFFFQQAVHQNLRSL